MDIGAHDDHVGACQVGMVAQGLGDIPIHGRQRQDIHRDAMAGEMRRDLRAGHRVRQVLLARDADQLDLSGGPQERQGVIEGPRRLGAAVPRHDDPVSREGFATLWHDDERPTAVHEHGLDQSPIDGQGNRFRVEDRQVMGAGEGAEAPDEVRIGKLRRLRGAGHARCRRGPLGRVGDRARKRIQPAVLGGHEPFGKGADEGMGQGQLQRGRLDGDMGVRLPGEREPVGQGGRAFLGVAFFRDPDQDAANVLEHGILPLNVWFGFRTQ